MSSPTPLLTGDRNWESAAADAGRDFTGVVPRAESLTTIENYLPHQTGLGERFKF